MYHQHERVQIDFTNAKLMTKQSFQEECDINGIMSKFEKTGLLEHLNTHHGDYGNYLGFEDYHTSVNRVIEAQQTFMTIPAAVRAIFKNDPAKFMEFAQNPENIDELVEMGLATQKPDPLKERAEALKTETGGKPPVKAKEGIQPSKTATEDNKRVPHD